jgi:ubiquinone/menaquinone biosynthesis C-methylase UbiE
VTKKDSGWWDDFFPTFRPLFDMIPQRVTNAEVRFLVRKFDLKLGSRFLDCPCGIGRISIPLAKMGINVVGVDSTQSYLEELDRKAKRRNLNISLVQSDMRRVTFDGEFDVAANLWTSLGYFEEESDNVLVLKKMFTALKPGGRFLLHLINRDWMMASYESRDWFEVKNTTVLERRSFDYRNSRSLSTWRIVRQGQQRDRDISLRVYSFHELAEMFERVGFVDVEGYGSVKEEPIDRNKRMMFILGTKPKRG